MEYFRPTIQRDQILSAAYGLPVGLLLSDSWILIIGVCLLAVITTAVAGTSLAFWLCPIFSFSVVTLLLLTIQLFGDFQVSSGVFRFLFFGAWGVCALSLRRSKHRFTCNGESVSLAVIAVLAAVLISRISWDPVEGFKTIVQHGEDNGAWLNNIAFGMSKGAAWSPDAGVSGGALLATVTTGAISFIDSSSYVASGIDPTGVILWRLYVWCLLMLIILGVAIFTRLTNSARTSLRMFLLPFMVLLTIAIGLNEVRSGYLTALLAAVWITSVLGATTIPFQLTPETSSVLYAVAIPMFLVVGEVWFPLFSWTLLIAAGLTLVVLSRWCALRRKVVPGKSWVSSRPFVTGGIVCLLILATFGIWFNSEYISTSSSSWARVLALIHTGGGGGISLFGVTVLLLAVAVVSKTDSRLQAPLTIVLTGTTITIALVLVLALVTPPYQIGYGPSKLFRILTLPLIPLACSALHWFLSARPGSKSASANCLAVSALLIATVQLGVPFQNLETLWKTQSPPFWFDAVVAARQRYPDRVPVCIDTVRGRGRSEGAYVCSRLAAGLIGAERTSIAGQIHMFQLGNICLIEPDEVHSLWNDAVFSNLVFVVSDRNRLSSEAECQSRELTPSDVSPFGKEDGYDVWPIGWLSSVRWNLARVIDLEGRDIDPNFWYLINDPLDAPNFEGAKLLTEYQLMSAKIPE